MKYSEDVPEGTSPNEVGIVIFNMNEEEPIKGLLIVTSDIDSKPMRIDIIPEGIRDEFGFTMTINPMMAHFIGAFQMDMNGREVGESTLAAGRLIWWLMMEVGQRSWKELRDG